MVNVVDHPSSCFSFVCFLSFQQGYFEDARCDEPTIFLTLTLTKIPQLKLDD